MTSPKIEAEPTAASVQDRDLQRQRERATRPGVIVLFLFTLANCGLLVVILNLFGIGSTSGGLVPAVADLPSLMTSTLFFYAASVGGYLIRYNVLTRHARTTA